MKWGSHLFTLLYCVLRMCTFFLCSITYKQILCIQLLPLPLLMLFQYIVLLEYTYHLQHFYHGEKKFFVLHIKIFCYDGKFKLCNAGEICTSNQTPSVTSTTVKTSTYPDTTVYDLLPVQKAYFTPNDVVYSLYTLIAYWGCHKWYFVAWEFSSSTS